MFTIKVLNLNDLLLMGGLINFFHGLTRISGSTRWRGREALGDQNDKKLHVSL